jgi:hypothetical protein
MQFLLVPCGQKRIELELEMFFLLERSTDRASVKLNRTSVDLHTQQHDYAIYDPEATDLHQDPAKL